MPSSRPRPEKKKSAGDRILVGTASWTDPGFVAHWYPKGMPAADRLGWYAEQFQMVEINSTFYAVPDPRMVERWCRSTPADFTFNLKLHQLLSRHATAAKLLPPVVRRQAETNAQGKVKLTSALEAAMIDQVLGPIRLLEANGKLGVLLLQMSPAFSPRAHSLEELAPLLTALRAYRIAIELRNRNWVEGGCLTETLRFFRENILAFVSVDAPAQKHFTIMPPDLNPVTNIDIAYLRLHGRDAKAYTTGKTVAARFNYDYNDEEIEAIACRSKELAREARQVHVIFNNNALDYAPHAALRLRKALGQLLTAPPRQRPLL